MQVLFWNCFCDFLLHIDIGQCQGEGQVFCLKRGLRRLAWMQLIGGLTERQKADRVMEELRRKRLSGNGNGLPADPNRRQDSKATPPLTNRAAASAPARTSGLLSHGMQPGKALLHH